MQINMRKEKRRITKAIYYICWEVRPGEQESAEVQGINTSSSGLRFSSGVDLQPGTVLFIQSQEDEMTGYATVRNCVACDGGYQTGVELTAETKKVVLPGEEDVDFYEFLQISPRADVDTIRRIYRFLASRFHPDNPDTGDSEKFVLLTRAYTVLSDRELRRNYDATRKMREPEPRPAYQSVDFMDGVEGEVNRRMAVLSILYNTRRTNPHAPGVSMLKLEKQMAFPREYLDFTVWYLRSKKYIISEDNSELALTAAGVDYVEENYSKIPVLNKLLLLDSGSQTASDSPRTQEPKDYSECERFIKSSSPKDRIP